MCQKQTLHLNALLVLFFIPLVTLHLFTARASPSNQGDLQVFKTDV